MEGELMPTYIYKGCIVKENRDGLLQNVQQKTVPVLGCSGLIFACRVDLRLLVGVCCWWRMLLDAPACMVDYFTSVTCQRCLWRRVLVRLAPPIVVPFPRSR